jgi:membrane protein
VEELNVARPEYVQRASRLVVPLRSHYMRVTNLVRSYRVLVRALHRTALSVLDHDCLNVAQSTAYSAIVALFPALIVAAAVVGLLPDTAPVRFQLAAFFERVLPPGVSPLLDTAFVNTPNHTHSLRALISAALVSFAGASNVIATLMEGLRRARDMPQDCWTFWQRRRRAFKLVPMCLAPLALVSLLVVFGHAINGWLAPTLGPGVRASIYMLTLLIRWVVALAASVGVIAVLYHLGIPESPTTKPSQPLVHRSWKSIVPGAVMATLMWFLTTLIFGWYLTRFANYSEVYGSLGAGIALLFWLYIISLSVLCGAEFNAQFDSQLHAHFGRPPRKTMSACDVANSSSHMQE